MDNEEINFHKNTCCRIVVIFVCGIRNAMNDVQQEMSHLKKCQEEKRHTLIFFVFSSSSSSSSSLYNSFYKIVTIVRDVIFDVYEGYHNRQEEKN